jgi:hypothetical protein
MPVLGWFFRRGFNMWRQTYQCAGCAHIFPTGEAVDGFKEGYSQGFLCPRCRVNLEETTTSDDPGELHLGYSFLMFNALLVIFYEHIRWITAYEQSPWLNAGLNVLSVWLPVCLVFVFINRKALFSPTLVYTRKVPGRHNH